MPARMLMRHRGPSVLAWLMLASALVLPACFSSDDLSAPAPGTVLVSARDNLFAPETVTVQQGRNVRWTNQGRDVHTVVTEIPSVHSELIAPGGWFEARLDTTGTFQYRCSRHEEMTGTVIVQ